MRTRSFGMVAVSRKTVNGFRVDVSGVPVGWMVLAVGLDAGYWVRRGRRAWLAKGLTPL